jgi:hypothetical protein
MPKQLVFPWLLHQLEMLVLREKFNPMRNGENLLELERLNADNRNEMIPLTFQKLFEFVLRHAMSMPI